MSAHSGPKLAAQASDILLSVDFTDSKCYPGSGTTVTDYVTKQTGTVYNAPTYSRSKQRGFLTFNGTNTYVGIANKTTLDVQTVSVAVWARTNNTTQAGFFFEKGAVNTQYALFQEGANFTWRHQTPTTSSLTAPAASYVNTSDWFYLVGTFTSGDRRMYVNGKQVASDTLAGTLATNASGMTIGSYNSGGYYYSGDIGLVRVYNRVLTASEIDKNYKTFKSRFD